MATVRDRETASDSRFNPDIHYVYILGCGTILSMSVRQTTWPLAWWNTLLMLGRKRPRGRSRDWCGSATPNDRDGAKQMEQRLQAALKRSRWTWRPS